VLVFVILNVVVSVHLHKAVLSLVVNVVFLLRCLFLLHVMQSF